MFLISLTTSPSCLIWNLLLLDMTLYSLFLSSLGLNLHGIVHVKLSLMTMLVICVVSWVILFYHTVPYYVTMLNAVILIIYLTLIDMLKLYQPRASAQLLAPFRSPLVNSLVAYLAGLNMLHHIRKSHSSGNGCSVVDLRLVLCLMWCVDSCRLPSCYCKCTFRCGPA